MSAKIKYTFIKDAKENILSGITSLYKAQGWLDKEDTSEKLVKIIYGSAAFLIAENQEGRIIGMARAIGDGISDAYMQDITVAKEFRGQGIGTELVIRLKKHLESLGYSWIGLIAQDNSRLFYMKAGFKQIISAAPMMSDKSHV